MQTFGCLSDSFAVCGNQLIQSMQHFDDLTGLEEFGTVIGRVLAKEHDWLGWPGWEGIQFFAGKESFGDAPKRRREYGCLSLRTRRGG
jgi:hypothetical protein